MKRALVFLFLLGSLHLKAEAKKELRDLFLNLPDSVFTQFNSFGMQDSFPRSERMRILSKYDSASGKAETVTEVRFSIRYIDDSLGRILLDNFSDQTITLQILEQSKKEIFFSVCASECDFVQCKQVWKFYLKKKKSISEVKDVLPTHFPMRLFFDPAYLQEMGVDPELDIHGINMYYGDENLEITAYLNTDYFDKELFGEEHPMVKLNPDKLIRSEIKLKRNGKQFEMLLQK